MSPRNNTTVPELPLVEVIVVAFNSGDSLANCLSALAAAGNDLNLSVTVIDNCSSQNIALSIPNVVPLVEVFRSRANLGYGGGNNIGIRRALEKQPCPDAILVLNPDVELPPNAISELYAVLQETGCAAVSPRISDGSGANEETPRRSLWGRRLRSFDISGRRLINVDRLAGSCMLVRTEALAKVGLFDEKYFLYWEEIDLCFRMRLAGYVLLIAEDVAAVHYGAGIGCLKRHRTYYTWRNQFYFSFKNYGPLLGILFVARRLLIADVREVFDYLKRGRLELILAGLAGLWAGLRGELGLAASRFASPESPLRGA